MAQLEAAHVTVSKAEIRAKLAGLRAWVGGGAVSGACLYVRARTCIRGLHHTFPAAINMQSTYGAYVTTHSEQGGDRDAECAHHCVRHSGGSECG